LFTWLAPVSVALPTELPVSVEAVITLDASEIVPADVSVTFPFVPAAPVAPLPAPAPPAPPVDEMFAAMVMAPLVLVRPIAPPFPPAPPVLLPLLADPPDPPVEEMAALMVRELPLMLIAPPAPPACPGLLKRAAPAAPVDEIAAPTVTAPVAVRLMAPPAPPAVLLVAVIVFKLLENVIVPAAVRVNELPLLQLIGAPTVILPVPLPEVPLFVVVTMILLLPNAATRSEFLMFEDATVEFGL
jgi:hypothetical protein